ncbi:asc-type amino acid transporter 1 [Tupaia chinensis]|uniref:asc-type amino acid transporter 1 n=1 Tax=Tupaia chinensis TaxID=246437 RepID=UPI0003C91A07|nr:asc-type amino acid transporter 1 [Tupaia chinensis]
MRALLCLVIFPAASRDTEPSIAPKSPGDQPKASASHYLAEGLARPLDHQISSEPPSRQPDLGPCRGNGGEGMEEAQYLHCKRLLLRGPRLSEVTGGDSGVNPATAQMLPQQRALPPCDLPGSLPPRDSWFSPEGAPSSSANLDQEVGQTMLLACHPTPPPPGFGFRLAMVPAKDSCQYLAQQAGPGPGASERVTLKKEIGLLSACTIIIGNIIGSGIFISPKGVLEHSGSVGLALFVWVLGGGVTALGSLCYAELGVAIPKSGGDYSYVTEIFGGLAGFLLLWSAVLIMYPTSLAVISMTFSNYVLQPVFPNCIPPAAASRVLSMACLMLLTWVNSSSVRWATRIQDVFTGGKLLALSLIIGVGFVQIFQGHFEELRPSNAFAFWMTPSVGHLALAFLQGSFAFSGWNFLNYVTEELVDPRKNLPRAIFISIPLVTFVYTFTNIAYFTAMSPQELLSSNAVAVTFGEKLLGYFSWVMPVSVALSTFGGINGYLFTSSRLCFSGAREGHLPSLLAMIHVRRCTPIPALLVCCGATAVIMLVGDTYTLINYVSFINYLCYGVTILGLLVLRWRRPALHRPIKVNLLVPITYLVFWAFLLVFSFISEPMVCGVGVIIILTGVPIFFLGVFWRSKPKCVHRLTESMTRWGQELCFVVYPQDSPEEEEKGPFQPSPLPTMDKPLKTQ